MKPLPLFRQLRTAGLAMLLLLPAFQVFAACQFNTISAVAFGAYDVFSGIADTATGSIRISSCGGAPFTAALSTGSSGTFSPRAMVSINDTLQYNLYTDATYSTIWGDGSGGTATMSNRGSITFTVYGRVPAGQDASAGTYTDTIVTTITF